MGEADRQGRPDLGGMPAGTLILTGATGFLGGVLVRRFLASGLPPHRLRCLVRDPERARRAGIPPESLAVVDLGRDDLDERLRAAVCEAGAVVHLAGTLKAFDRAGFDAVNALGTARLVRAVAAIAPAAHWLQVSSLAAVGPSVDGVGSDRPPHACRTVSHYGESKRQGELAVVASGLRFTVLRPPVVYGPHDGATRLLFRQASAPLTAVPPRTRPLSVLHADDVAEALWRAVMRRPEGAFVPLDGPERTDTHAFVRAIAAACARRARLLPVPMSLAAIAAHGADLFARMRRAPGYFNRDKVREIAAPGWVADGTRARELLGFVPAIGLSSGLRAVAEAEGCVRGAARGVSGSSPRP